MALNRISNLSVYQNTFRNVLSSETELAKLQRQISSGLKADNFEELNGQVEQFSYLQSRTTEVVRYQQNNTIASARLKTGDQALSQIQDLVSKMIDLTVQRRNPALAGDLNFQQQMGDYVKSVASELNMTFEGRYIFAGTATDTAPVPDGSVAQVEDGVPDAGYYKGSTQDVEFRADDNISFSFPARADDPAFQKLFAAANLALKGDVSNDDATIAKAVDMLNSASEDVTALRGTVNSTILNVDRINDRHKTLQLYWQGVTEEVSKTDLVAASIQVTNYQAILQASFQAYSRLSGLKLSDYLR